MKQGRDVEWGKAGGNKHFNESERRAISSSGDQVRHVAWTDLLDALYLRSPIHNLEVATHFTLALDLPCVLRPKVSSGQGLPHFAGPRLQTHPRLLGNNSEQRRRF